MGSARRERRRIGGVVSLMTEPPIPSEELRQQGQPSPTTPPVPPNIAEARGGFSFIVDWCIRITLLLFLAIQVWPIVRSVLPMNPSTAPDLPPSSFKAVAAEPIDKLLDEARNAIEFDQSRRGTHVPVQLEIGRIIPSQTGYVLLATNKHGMTAAFRVAKGSEHTFRKRHNGEVVVVGFCKGIVVDKELSDAPIVLFEKTQFVR